MSDQHDTQPGVPTADDVPVEGTPVDDALPLAGAPAASPAAAPAGGPGPGPRPPRGSELQDLVDQPAKVMRIGTMIKQLLDEVRSAPLDDAARIRLAEIHERSLHELEEGLSPELVAELHRITLPFVDNQAPSDAELRIAQAQLVGWLEGLFHGIQTALVVQQMGN